MRSRTVYTFKFTQSLFQIFPGHTNKSIETWRCHLHNKSVQRLRSTQTVTQAGPISHIPALQMCSGITFFFFFYQFEVYAACVRVMKQCLWDLSQCTRDSPPSPHPLLSHLGFRSGVFMYFEQSCYYVKGWVPNNYSSSLRWTSQGCEFLRECLKW